MLGDKNKTTPISSYQPSQAIRDFTALAKKDYAEGVRILENDWVELNGRSVIEDTSRGQMMFNAFVDTTVEDPNEAWKWRGTRSMARNKGIATHAQFMGNFLLPSYVAQNENDEVDQDFSEVMRDIAEWMANPVNSNYQSSYLQIGFGMLYNPVTYLGAEYCEVYQKIKEKTEDGKYKVKEVLDEVLSGFQAPIWGPTEVLITNAYERNIQKQRAIFQRRFAEKSELEAKYGEHKNWPFVQEGIKSIYNEEDGLFYDIKDDDHPHLCAEEIHKDRRNDSEVPFINGIYFGNEEVENNPIKHRDNRNAPKYNVIPFGFSRIGDHFFYYKSQMNALQWDNMAYDAMSEIVMNQAILQNEMPVAITGSDKIDSSIIFPNNVVAFEDKDTRITPLLPANNLASGFNALRETEKSMSEGSVNESISGQLPDASQKAFNVAQAQANAKKIMGEVGRSLAESLILYGDLMKDIILNHITVPQVEELVGGKMKMKYKTFFLENKTQNGKMSNRAYKFDESLIGLEMTPDELMDRQLKELEVLTNKEGKKYNEIKNYTKLINPKLFAKFKYLCKFDLQEMMTKSNEYWQPILLGLKAQLSQDPFVNQEWLTRKTLYAYFNSEGEEGLKEQSQQIPGLPQGIGSMANMALQKTTANAINGKIIQ